MWDETCPEDAVKGILPEDTLKIEHVYLHVRFAYFQRVSENLR